MQIKIGNKVIGDNAPCFIIAEAGVNANGDVKKAKNLIDIAKNAGADAVKFQTWITEELTTKTVAQADYQAKNTGKTESQYDMLKRLELSFDDFRELKSYAEQKGLIFLSTPADEKSIDFLDDLGVLAFKIGSGEVTNYFFLKQVATKHKPVILSTGMSNLEDVKTAVECIYKNGAKQLILLHCTTQYPTELKDVNLRAMETLKETFHLITGYSDHTLGILVPQLAVSMGAKVIEKHFTYDKHAEGPDHLCSLEPNELKEMVDQIRKVEVILGSNQKIPNQAELKIRSIVRKTLLAKVPIPKGTKITEQMVTVKRSEGSLEPKDFAKIAGKKTLIDLEKDQPLKLEHFETKK